MNYDDPTPKYILAIDHTVDYKSGFTYYALKSEDKACALAEAAIKAMKAKSVYCWLLLIRKGKATKGAAEYKKVARFYPNRTDNPADDCGTFDDPSTDFNGQGWGTLYTSEIR
ncbi:MAG: hypothetical protein ACI4RT_01750 [Candidatus Spyradenecus sp.]